MEKPEPQKKPEAHKKKIPVDLTDPRFEGKSKKAIKKIAKREFFEKTKKEWKQMKKDQYKERKRQRKLEEIPGIETAAKPKKLNKKDVREKVMELSKTAPRIVIDSNFESELDEKSLLSLVTQFAYCNSINKTAEHPVQLHITGIGPKTKALLAGRDYTKWVMHFHEKDYLELFNRDELVYLTGDSENVMAEFDPKTVYIIGGLVDHNRLKNITLNKATEQKIRTLRFPIDSHVQLATSSILTVNQCFQMMVGLYNGLNWHQTILSTIPKRKIVKDLLADEHSEPKSSPETKLKKNKPANKEKSEESEENSEHDNSKNEKSDESEDS